ncbi:sensor histidine kinase [Paraflavitalea sp. CAU 1676]|uniref:ligand-binding sensor domain-containing protein n=1 Tax=Paraflavitalea sp. CAU 1676 TaxID=3032598 RepID=UPI0023DBF9DC|nr:sensor histidine kinase [Paraflavitalea sp. CAU 1676]MDF2192715.1 two-component regulator propeller domain-containing protein [Paraflavitalea sp. CAU 1676]
MKNFRCLLGGLIGLFVHLSVYAQIADIYFHDITVRNGLNDGNVTSINQDKYGYIWIATQGGLNRFNGTTIERFTHKHGDSTSAPGSIPYSITSGPDGRLWFACDNGLYEFDFPTNQFKKHPRLQNWFIEKLIASSNNRLFLICNGSLYEYNTVQEKLTDLKDKNAAIHQHPTYSLFLSGDLLYIGSKGGYIAYNSETNQAVFNPVSVLSQLTVNRIMVDKTGYVWLSNFSQYKLVRHHREDGQSEVISDHPSIKSLNKTISYNDLICDSKNNTWITTNVAGLLQYIPATKQVNHYLNHRNKDTYNADYILICLFSDADERLWIGKVGGCSYFYPDKNLFSTLLPFPEKERIQTSRIARQDKGGNYWFSTGLGISYYDPRKNTWSVWRNEPNKKDVIYNNSVRGLEIGDDGRVWLATAGGINCYDPKNKKMTFFDEKDSIPKVFYFTANKDRKGRIWFGTNRYDGLYYYSESVNKFYSVRNHPLLKKFTGYSARIVYNDSKGRIWVGYGNGLAMADEKNGVCKFWENNDSSRKTIIGNLVIDIKEDKKGVVWISTFNGVTGIDLEKDQYYWINESQGLKTNIATSLAVDTTNQLWIGTAAGLYMLDEKRQNLYYFDEASGLTSAAFTEHAGYQLDDIIIMPTTKGFIKFRPSEFKKEENKIPFYIASVEVQSEKKWVDKEMGSQLHLNARQNSFTLYLEALNYSSPSQTWFAYKLSGFEKEWHYTTDPKAVYTNIPGGSYTFLYKAAMRNKFDHVEGKQFTITIKKHFYKTTWFWMLISGSVALLLYALYRNRMNKQRRILLLETKAEALEKEKTLVQYESLKQQLNPHFLFNSLTSLRSLIKSDTKQATGFLDGLSKVYRYVLKSGDQELVSLHSELEFVKVFIDLQKTRFGEGLQANITIPAESYGRYIAPVSLQNLVENAIKHNTTDKDSPLVIDIYIDAEYVVVRNNLQKYHMVETSNKKGLASLQTLYRYYSEKPIEITADEKYFIVKIPLL